MTPSSTTALRRPVRQHVHLPQLDGLRTLAVVLVLGYHVVRTEEIPVLSGAFIGVDVFFVLSGFLITTLLLREHASSGRIDLRRFYVRRLWRLYPRWCSCRSWQPRPSPSGRRCSAWTPARPSSRWWPWPTA
jgi:hypothetical protein